VIRTICIAALLLSVVFGVSGFWLKAKASVGQVLLESAFNRSVGTGVNAKAWPWADTWPVAKLNLRNTTHSHIVLEGITGEAMAFGPGRIPASSSTAASGAIVVGGHRDSHLEFLKEVDNGAIFDITTIDGETQAYKVMDRFVADSEQDTLMVPTDMHALILITCYPFNALQTGGALRYVVVAMPVGETKIAPTV